MAKYCIGIDLGGTTIKAGLLDQNRTPSGPVELPTPTDRGSEGVVEQLAAAAMKVMSQYGVARKDVVGIGIGSAGPLKITEGIIISSPNIPNVQNVPVRAMMAKALDLPCALENDANAAAFGEYLHVAGQGVRDLVLLTLGTGVGGGIVIDGKVLHGAHEVGAELGHMLIYPGGEPCNCGQRGCLERYSSATFMALRARQAIERQGDRGVLAQRLAQKGTINSRDVNEARNAGDPLAAKMWDEAAFALAVACISIARMLDPDEIALGGGLANAGDDLLTPVREHFQRMHWSLTPPLTKINLARLGNDAGFIGAAGVAWQAFGT